MPAAGKAEYVYNKINEDLRDAGLPVQAEDIIDIIDGYNLPEHGYTPSQEALGRYLQCFLVQYQYRHNQFVLFNSL